MLSLINNLSILDDLLIIAGVVLIGYGQFPIGGALAVIGLGIMFAKGEIGFGLK